MLSSRKGKDGSELDVSFSTSAEEEEGQILGLLMDSTGELFPRGERMWFLLSGMEGVEQQHPKVLCCALLQPGSLGGGGPGKPSPMGL